MRTEDRIKTQIDIHNDWKRENISEALGALDRGEISERLEKW